MKKLSLCFILVLSISANAQIEIEQTVTRDNITGVLNTHIQNKRLPQVSLLPNGYYLVVAFPSKAIGQYRINCAQVEFNYFLDELPFQLSFRVDENPFVQVVPENDGLYTIIKLRRLCFE